MAVELKNISALRNGVDNPSFDTTGVSYLTRLYKHCVHTRIYVCIHSYLRVYACRCTYELTMTATNLLIPAGSSTREDCLVTTVDKKVLVTKYR